MEICTRCKEEGKDRRILYMACGYEMRELGIPFELNIIPDERERKGFAKQKHHFYTLCVCKECRAEWMTAIQWWMATPKKEPCGSGIFIKENGGIFEVTESEFKRRHPDKEPVRVKNE